jgi:hypothetical protein
MLLADLMTFKVKFELVSQHVMLLADLMTFKVKFESASQHSEETCLPVDWCFSELTLKYRISLQDLIISLKK